MALNDNELNIEKKYLKKVFGRICEENEELSVAIKDKYSSIVNANKVFGEDVPILNGEVDFDEVVEIYKFNDIVETEEKHYNDMAARLRILRQMYDSAYFGKITFLEDGERFADDYYIGISTLRDEDSDFLVLDWRAPVCNLYYECESGPCSYECPAGTISGNLTAKRQFGIFRDNINYVFDTDVLIEDKLLCRVLSESRDKKMGNIVKSIQKEQNTAIRLPEAKDLVVFGPAGSGKTSVAMHRAAYVLYKHRDTIKAGNILVLSPNSVFRDYISDVLPDLGEANVNIMTVSELFAPLLSDFTIRTHADFMNASFERSEKQDFSSAAFKNSTAFLEILKRYAHFIDKTDFTPKNIVHRGRIILSAEEINQLYYHDWAKMSCSQRLKRIASRAYSLLEGELERRRKEIADENADLFTWEIEELQTKLINEEFSDVRSRIDSQFSLDTKKLYADLFKSKAFFETVKDIAGIDFDTFSSMLDSDAFMKSNELEFEDFYPMLFMRCVADGQKVRFEDPIRFVFTDEFQDISPVGLFVLSKMFDRASMTLVGDTNQTIDRSAQIYDENVLSLCLGDKADIFRLTKSYRSTAEISLYASRLISDASTEFMDRHGDPVEEKHFDSYDEKVKDLLAEIPEVKSRGFNSIGIICRTKADADKLYERIKGESEVSLIISDSDRYSSGTTILPSYLSKGLEFDAVFIFDADSYILPDELRLYYTVCTRAMHKLTVFN